MFQECAVCGHPVGDQAQLCSMCTGILTRNLREMPDLAAELDLTLSRQDQLTARSDGSRSCEVPLVFKTAAGDTLRDLRAGLRSWVECIAGADHADTDHPIPTLARFLVNIVGTIRQHEAAPQMAVAMAEAVREARRVIDRPPELLYVGPCGAETCGEDGDDYCCDEELYARPNADTVVCRICGAEHSAHERRAWLLERVEDQLVTYSEACSALPGLMDKPLKVGTVKSWVSRDQLAIKGFLHRQYPRDVVLQERSHAHDSPLVRVGDVIKLVFGGAPLNVAA